jgi:hypothetical protein
MTVQLKIRFDGTTEGVAEHKLELSAFSNALKQLVATLRRIASGLVDEATEQSSGRFKHDAELRVFLDSLSGGSLQMNLDVSSPPIAPGYSIMLFDDLPSRTAERFIESIKAEGNGVFRSLPARRFLGSLPKGITSQKYEVYSDGNLLCEASLGEVSLADEAIDLPIVVKTVARITGIIFEPTLEVRFDADGEKLSCSASTEMIDKAILLRSEDVLIMATLHGGKGRLLWIGTPGSFPARMTRSDRSNHVLARWQRTLAELAK